VILTNAADEAALGTSAHTFAAAIGLSRRTLSRWKIRDQRAALADRPPVPNEPRRVREPERDEVLWAYVLSTRTYGGRTLADLTGVPHATADRIIAAFRERHGSAVMEPPARVEILFPLVVLSADDACVEDFRGTTHRFMPFQDEMSRLKLQLLFQRSIRSWRIRRTLEAIFVEVGVPLLFKSDRDRRFKSRAVLTLLEAYGVLWFPGPPYYPPFNGKDERANSEFLAYVHNDPAWPGVVGRDLRDLFVKALVHLNHEKPRAVLGGKTSAQVFRPEDQLKIDRKEFAEEVSTYGQQLRAVYPKLIGGLHAYRRWAITCALLGRGLAKIEGQKVSTFLQPVLGQKI
jgi:hypothetical protein